MKDLVSTGVIESAVGLLFVGVLLLIALRRTPTSEAEGGLKETALLAASVWPGLGVLVLIMHLRSPS